ncbi:hypothetical protein BO94DRAFT_344547 [Aspergillus sclerotioniger CBS 115572]|uniref:Uncharacterized protein n=1 Tax=Aspergillus sclerotioniger CBS 115572 TaxID=1450535 RepID=A0A317X9A1_9EURO|nr:hypothetical protein BO94DRAFT_344547 [Aspergillus sclerotioniger CBS 115572]PWY93498.1 hypothetical protein BO94DRAFT_344547 [Aspergillus sclerotioniger CBS 115572]
MVSPTPKQRVVRDPHLQPSPPHQPQAHQGQRPTTTPRAIGGAGGAARPGVKDIRQTKEYKIAARRWLSTMVALPILMYTSWSLWERTYGEKSPRRLPTSTSTSSSPVSSSGGSGSATEKEGEK